MKAAIYNPEAKDRAYLSIDEIDKPKLNDKNAIVRITGVGVCGSDLLKLNRSLVKPGIVLGHEMVGTIEEISKEMSQKYNLKLGDRILSSHHVPCLKCNHCLNQQESLCTQFKTTNFNPGAFCEYLELSELHLKYTVQKIPNNLGDKEASFTEPLACCIKAIERSGLKNYQGQAKVLIIGLGSIGLMLGQLAKYYKPDAQVTGNDLMESRLELAQNLGFDKSSAVIASEAKQSTTNHFDFTFLSAGATASIDSAISHAANGATIVVFSSVANELKGYTNNDIYYKELTVLGSYSPNLSNLKESLELISGGKIQVKELITHESNLENLGATIEQLKIDKGIKAFLNMSKA